MGRFHWPSKNLIFTKYIFPTVSKRSKREKKNLNLKPSISVCDHWFCFHVLNGQAKNTLFCFWVQALFLTELSIHLSSNNSKCLSCILKDCGTTFFNDIKCYVVLFLSKWFSYIFWSTLQTEPERCLKRFSKMPLYCSRSLNLLN